MTKKYRLLIEEENGVLRPDPNSPNCTLTELGVNETLYRIVALVDIPSKGIFKGMRGGWVASEANLSQHGDCFVLDDAMVFDGALVAGNALVSEDARVSGGALVAGNAELYEEAHVTQNAEVHGDAVIRGRATVTGNAFIDAPRGRVIVEGEAVISEFATIESTVLYSDITVSGKAQVKGAAKVYDEVSISGHAIVEGRAALHNKVKVSGDAIIKGHTYVIGQAVIDGGCYDLSIDNKALSEHDGLIETPDQVKQTV